LKYYCILILLLGFVPTVLAQGICDDPTYTKGDFDLSTASLCLPGSVTAADKSGGASIKYYFDYKSEPFTEASYLATASTSASYAGVSRPGVYTVLQLGKKNGKTTVACKTLEVRPHNTPLFSYNICGVVLNTLDITIPKHPLNNFDRYQIDLGPGSFPITISAADLPYSASRFVGLPRSIKVEGFYNNPTQGCASTVPSIYIPPVDNGNGTYRPYAPNIDKVELLSPQKVQVSYSGPFTAPGTPALDLYMYPRGNWAGVAPIQKNITPGEVYTFPIPDSTKSYCFYASRPSTCGVLNEQSAEICTLPLVSANFSVNPISYELLWNNYPPQLYFFPNTPAASLTSGVFLNTDSSPKQLYTYNLSKGNRIVTNFKFPDFRYTDTNIDCKDAYCYQVRQNLTGRFNFNTFSSISISNTLCVNRSKIVPPALAQVWVSTNANQRNQISWTSAPLSTWLLNPTQYYLHKRQGSAWDRIDSTKTSKTLFDSTGISKAETYSVGYVDQCNSLSALSSPVSSVFLSEKSPAVLTWTNGNPFSDKEILHYELLPLDETTLSPQTGTVLSPSTFLSPIVTDNYTAYAPFVVKVTGEGSPAIESFSNILKLPIVPNLYLPSAFTPNGDSNNPELKIFGNTPRFATFSFEIFDRTGQKLASFNDINQSWNGTFHNKPVPAGSYAYIIRGVLDNGEVFKKSGSIEVMR
jgi:gliding motility-associated-like protein